MSASFGPYPCFARPLFLAPVALGLLLMTPATLVAQSVPPALVSPPLQAPQTGPHGEKLPGMPNFMIPRPTTSTSTPVTSRSSTVRASPGGTRIPPSGASRTASW
jgi:hypothetical protein